MYRLTLNGKPFGQPMPKAEAEKTLREMKWVCLGLGMRWEA